MAFWTGLLHPEGFHGHGKTRRFFEGWYLKLVSADRSQRWAVIPGVFLGPEGGGEAFVQVLDGSTRQSWYCPFPLSAFRAEAERFEVTVGASHFSSSGLSLSLDGAAPLEGSLRFSKLTPWPVSVVSPGIMGPFAWAPFMECYHGVVSLFHELSGSLRIGGREVSFDGGVGYLEKDWGQAFPSAYVWMQSSHFTTPRASLVASAAIIPWLRGAFPGFIAGLWFDGTLHRFATYTGARLERLEISATHVHLTLADRRQRLELSTARPAGALLHAPIRTEMHKRVEESLDASISVRLSRRSGQVLFEETGVVGGLEVHGAIEQLVTMARG